MRSPGGTVLALCLLAASCGRIGFDPRESLGETGVTDGGARDAAEGADGAARDDVTEPVFDASPLDAARADVGGADARADAARADVLDAARADGALDAGACSLLGVWSTGLSPTSGFAYIRFRADGTFQAANDIASLDSAPASTGRYSFTGGRLVIREQTAYGCARGDEGTYNVSFVGCASAAMVLERDQCALRGASLLTLTLTRRG